MPRVQIIRHSLLNWYFTEIKEGKLSVDDWDITKKILKDFNVKYNSYKEVKTIPLKDDLLVDNIKSYFNKLSIKESCNKKIEHIYLYFSKNSDDDIQEVKNQKVKPIPDKDGKYSTDELKEFLKDLAFRCFLINYKASIPLLFSLQY